MTKAERQRLQGAVDDLPKWLAWRIAERITSWDRTQLADEQFVRLSDLCAALAACLAAEGEEALPTAEEVRGILRAAKGKEDKLLSIAGLVNAYHNDGTTLTAAEMLKAIADALGPPMEQMP